MNRRIINELDVSKIGDERHMRSNFNIILSRATDENDRIEQFQKIKSMVEKQGWKIVGKRPGNYEGETLIVAGPKSRKELGETIDSDPGCQDEVQRIETALSSAQMKMMQASKQAADEKETIMDGQIKHIANIITEDPNVIKESYTGGRGPHHWQEKISMTYEELKDPALGNGSFNVEYVVGADWNKEEPMVKYGDNPYPGSPGYWDWEIIDITEIIDAQGYNLVGIRSAPTDAPAGGIAYPFVAGEGEGAGDQLTPEIKRKFRTALMSSSRYDERMQSAIGWGIDRITTERMQSAIGWP